jgi:hypothetical protein
MEEADEDEEEEDGEPESEDEDEDEDKDDVKDAGAAGGDLPPVTKKDEDE